MAKKNQPPSAAGSSKKNAPGAIASELVGASSRNARETVESIVIAFILAFLFRTFAAEAFVIPTGSMAPTLQGRHKDVNCPKCGCRYRASASFEVDDDGSAFSWLKQPETPQGRQIVRVTCPQCRFPLSVDPEPTPTAAADPIVAAGAKEISYNGDRIIVGKFMYEFQDPRRWDVIVFKFPGDTNMNYIKRLVGLPNEEVRIFHGDLFTRPSTDPGAAWTIARKPPDKAWVLRQSVFDTAYEPIELHRAGWPSRFGVAPSDVARSGAWQTQVEEGEGPAVQRTYSIDGASEREEWLRYRHFVPRADDWARVKQGKLTVDSSPRPQLISDFYAFNMSLTRVEANVPYGDEETTKRGLHWVGDLMIEADLSVESSEGTILLDLVEGGVHFRCELDVAGGTVKFSHGASEAASGTLPSPITGPGEYQVTFANFDDQLILWVDGKVVAVAPYGDLASERPQTSTDDAGDLAPAAIGSRGAALSVQALRVYRDVYYIADKSSVSGRPITDLPDSPILAGFSSGAMTRLMTDPGLWGLFAQRTEATFKMGPDQFFVLGDNSPFSKDGRLWAQDNVAGLYHYVPRELLIGKALFIYWPHSWDRIPGTSIPFPFFPNFSDMGLVR